MKQCISCGKYNDDDMLFCEDCGSALTMISAASVTPIREDRIGDFVSEVKGGTIGDTLEAQFKADKTEINAYAHNMKTLVPDKLSACDGEIPIRQFFCATERFALLKLDIYHLIQVTNKRLIYCRMGNSILGPKVDQEEVPLCDVSSVSIKRGFKINLLALVCALLSFFGFFGSLFSLQSQPTQSYGMNSFGAKAISTGFSVYSVMVFLILLVISMLFLSRRYFKVCIGSRGGSSYPICSGDDDAFGKIGVSLGVKGDFLDVILSVKPTENVDRVERELNAMILDIQQLGDYGIKKWQ